MGTPCHVSHDARGRGADLGRGLERAGSRARADALRRGHLPLLDRIPAMGFDASGTAVRGKDGVAGVWGNTLVPLRSCILHDRAPAYLQRRGVLRERSGGKKICETPAGECSGADFEGVGEKSFGAVTLARIAARPRRAYRVQTVPPHPPLSFPAPAGNRVRRGFSSSWGAASGRIRDRPMGSGYDTEYRSR